MKPDCERFFEDPDAHAEHLETCANCAAIFAGEDVAPASAGGTSRVNVDSLPLAPWEGADFRSWPLVLGGGLTLITLALALFAVTGTRTTQLMSTFPSIDVLTSAVQMLGSTVREAPVLILGSFVIVNLLLYALLRRAPRGIDV